MTELHDENVLVPNAYRSPLESEASEDIVDETSMESFPASDPPSWNRGREEHRPHTRQKSA